MTLADNVPGVVIGTAGKAVQLCKERMHCTVGPPRLPVTKQSQEDRCIHSVRSLFHVREADLFAKCQF